jgi:hypothetical protein
VMVTLQRKYSEFGVLKGVEIESSLSPKGLIKETGLMMIRYATSINERGHKKTVCDHNFFRLIQVDHRAI